MPIFCRLQSNQEERNSRIVSTHHLGLYFAYVYDTYLAFASARSNAFKPVVLFLQTFAHQVAFP